METDVLIHAPASVVWDNIKSVREIVALGGTDLSWIVGLPVAAASYWLLSLRRETAVVGVRAPASGSGT